MLPLLTIASAIASATIPSTCTTLSSRYVDVKNANKVFVTQREQWLVAIRYQPYLPSPSDTSPDPGQWDIAFGRRDNDTIVMHEGFHRNARVLPNCDIEWLPAAYAPAPDAWRSVASPRDAVDKDTYYDSGRKKYMYSYFPPVSDPSYDKGSYDV